MLIQRLILIALYTLFFFSWGRLIQWVESKWSPLKDQFVTLYFASVFAIAFCFVDFPYYDFTRLEWIGIGGGFIALLFDLFNRENKWSIPYEYGWPVLCGPATFLAHTELVGFTKIMVIFWVFFGVVLLFVFSKIKSLQLKLGITLVSAIASYTMGSDIFLSIVMVAGLLNLLVLDRKFDQQVRNTETPLLNYLTVYLIIGFVYRLTL
jgi:hypothetical protein